MKKNIAVLGVINKMSIFKIITVLMVMGGAQIAVVYGEILRGIKENIINDYSFYHYLNLDALLWIFLGAFLLINLVLVWCYAEKKGTHTVYFYKHIQTSRNQKCLINMFYAIFCYLLLFTWQIAVTRMIVLFVRSMTVQEGASIYQYLSGIYYVDLLNGIFNLNNNYVLFINLLFILLFGIEVAKVECKKNIPIGLILLFILYSVTYKERIDSKVLCIVLLVVLSVWALIKFIGIMKYSNDEEGLN